MHPFNIDHVLAQLRRALEHDDLDLAAGVLERLRSQDQADVFTELDDEDQVALLPHLDPSQSADILEDLEDQDAADLISALSTETAASIVDEMEPDEAADVLGAITGKHANEILTILEDPEEVRPLLVHPSDSAGGLMTSDFLALRRRMTASEALKAIRAWSPPPDTAYYLFVVDQHGRLCGVVGLRQIVVARPDVTLGEIMNPDVISVQVGVDQEECARLMRRYDLLALPVIDDSHVLLGVITIDDVIDVLEEEATEDIQRLGGAEPLHQPYLSTGVLSIFRKRVWWLLLLFVTESLTGSVLRFFETELESVVSLAFFVPLLIGTGGNAGSQTTSTLIRALAVGDIRVADVLRSWWHEARVGLLLGVAMGAFGFVRALLWGSDYHLSLAVALALVTIVLWANSLGALLPLLAAKLRIDPTVVSGPVMSTLVDATGLFIYFTIARLILGL